MPQEVCNQVHLEDEPERGITSLGSGLSGLLMFYLAVQVLERRAASAQLKRIPIILKHSLHA
jgi:hypothetical protein